MSDVLPGTKGAKKSKRNKKFDNLIGPTDKNVDAQARERLVTARIGLLLRHSFFGNLATRLQLINADDWCATAATDGRKFYYNSRFVMLLKPKEVEFLVAHEVLHVVYDHMGRRGERDPQLFNIANDYAVNADLKRHKVGQFITTVPCLYETKYDGKSSEEIYDDLMQNVEKISMDDLVNQLLDDHLDGDGDGEGEDGDGDGDKETKGKGKRPKMTAEEREQLKQEIKQAILNAASSAEAGSLPKGVERLIKDVTSPVMPWRELIQTNLTSAIKTDFSFMRPSRRGWHMDAIMPAMTPGEEIDVDVFIDLSGSISDAQGRAFLSEVAGMMSAFDGYRINVACFDTEVYNPQTFTSENLESVDQYELVGGGGTDFDSIFNFLKKEGRVPNRLIVFTDGYPFGSWGDENYCDTTWIIHGDPNPNPPFGTFALYDDHKKH
jgi:predicted metal-dependent peptidase